jgi:hypothetical protein
MWDNDLAHEQVQPNTQPKISSTDQTLPAKLQSFQPRLYLHAQQHHFAVACSYKYAPAQFPIHPDSLGIPLTCIPLLYHLGIPLTCIPLLYHLGIV